jgi:hypothetical protein
MFSHVAPVANLSPPPHAQGETEAMQGYGALESRVRGVSVEDGSVRVTLGGVSDARKWHAVASLAGGRGGLVFGGEGRTSGELLRLDLEEDGTCVLFEPNCEGRTPGQRTGHSFVTLGRSAVLFGGLKGGKWSSDLAELHTDTYRWNRRAAIGLETPLPRCYHSAMALSPTRMLVMFGNDETNCFRDVWVLDTSDDPWAWTAPICVGPAPDARTGQAAALVSDRHVAVVGGWDPDESETRFFPTVHILDTVAWEWTKLTYHFSDSEPPTSSASDALKRTGHSATVVVDPRSPEAFPRNRALLVLGGLGPDGTVRDDALLLQLPEFVLRAPVPPALAALHATKEGVSGVSGVSGVGGKGEKGRESVREDSLLHDDDERESPLRPHPHPHPHPSAAASSAASAADTPAGVLADATNKGLLAHPPVGGSALRPPPAARTDKRLWDDGETVPPAQLSVE